MSAPPAQALSTWAADCQKSAVRLAALAFRSSDWSASRMARIYARALTPDGAWEPQGTRGEAWEHGAKVSGAEMPGEYFTEQISELGRDSDVAPFEPARGIEAWPPTERPEEHTSESSHLVISYAVFCLQKTIEG